MTHTKIICWLVQCPDLAVLISSVSLNVPRHVKLLGWEYRSGLFLAAHMLKPSLPEIAVALFHPWWLLSFQAIALIGAGCDTPACPASLQHTAWNQQSAKTVHDVQCGQTQHAKPDYISGWKTAVVKGSRELTSIYGNQVIFVGETSQSGM